MASAPIDPQTSQFSERINNLETRNAFQDDVIEQLNEELTNHQIQIADLKQQLKLLAGRLKDIRPSDQSEDTPEPPPPHY